MDEELTKVAARILQLKLELENRKLQCLRERKPIAPKLLVLLREMELLLLMAERTARDAYEMEVERKEENTPSPLPVQFLSNLVFRK
jgi:hypothetical protein